MIRNAGLSYVKLTKSKSELYQDPCLPLLNAGKLDLPRHERAINQFCCLERDVRSGHDHIDHPTHGHDDVANAIAVAVNAAYNYTLFDSSLSWVDGTNVDTAAADAHQQEADSNVAWRRQQFDMYLMSLQHPDLNPMTGRRRSIWDYLPEPRGIHRFR